MKSESEFDYSPAPFWFLNQKLEKEEISRQIRLMHEAGVSGFFMHPRAGLKTSYLSDEWFSMIKHMVSEAKKAGIKAWLYDEDPFPSGAVGGSVFFEHPEFAAREIRFFEFTPDANGTVEEFVGHGIPLTVTGIRTDSKGKIVEQRDLTGSIGVIRPDYYRTEWRSSYYIQIFGKKEFPHYRAETFYPRLQIACSLNGGNWKVYVTTAEVTAGTEKYGALPDNLNKKCVKYFIEKTHEQYKRHCGEDFGSVIPGIFTDEPAVGNPVPWTFELENTFRKMHGYELKNNYHHLFRSFNDFSYLLRRDYWATIDRMFAENYFGQITKWCRKNSLELCGHCIGEENPTATTGGTDLTAFQKFFGIPGFDHITSNIPNGEFKSLNFGGKLISSAANRQGSEQVMSECFGCNPFNFGPDGMKKIANWLYSLGVNWLVPHGFFYSYDGYRKFDAGKSFFFQDPDFPEFKKFAAYARRTGEKLGTAKSLNHVCMIAPVSAIRGMLPAEPELAGKIRNQLYDCMQTLIEQKVQFDIADEETLLTGKIRNGVICCGKQKYDKIIILPYKDMMPEAVKTAVCLIRKSGIDVIEYPELPALRPYAGIFELAQTPKASYKAPLKSLMVTVKQNADGFMAYIFNNSPAPGMFDLKNLLNCEFCYVYNAETGKYAGMAGRAGVFTFAVEGFGAAIIEFRRKPLKAPQYKLPENLTKVEYEFEKNPEWDYLPPGEGWIAAFHRWDIAVSGNTIDRKATNQLFCLMREFTGTELPHMKAQRPRPIFDLAPELASVYPVHAEFSNIFELPADAVGKKLLLVFESETFSGDYQIFINGRELNKNKIRRQLVYDSWNQVAEIKAFCKSGRNSIKIIWKKAAEFDGMRSSVYIKV